MKKTALTAILITAITLLSASVFAQEGEAYFGANYEMWKYDSEYDDFNIGVLAAKLGYKANENFAIEGKIGIGINDDSTTVRIKSQDIKATYKPQITFGLFGVGSYPVNEQLEVYGKAGFNTFSYKIKAENLTYTNRSASVTETETELAIGFGGNFYFDGAQGVNFEMLIPHPDIITLSLGYVRKF